MSCCVESDIRASHAAATQFARQPYVVAIFTECGVISVAGDMHGDCAARDLRRGHDLGMGEVIVLARVAHVDVSIVPFIGR